MKKVRASGFRAVTVALALVAGTAPVAQITASGAGQCRPVLGTAEQIAHERQAIRLLDSAEVRAEIARLEKQYGSYEDLYRQSPRGTTSAIQPRMHEAFRSWALTAAQIAVNNVDAPIAMWATAPHHFWSGVAVPDAGSDGIHPDNAYRYISIDGAARYEILIHVHRPAPAQVTFALDAPEKGAPAAVHIKKFSAVELDRLTPEADGSYRITVDSSPADGRTNHLQSVASARFQDILIRDTLSNWAVQNPVEIAVRRIGGPAIGPQPKAQELAQKTAAILSLQARFWLDWDKTDYPGKPNMLRTPYVRKDGPSGWGMITMGGFGLNDGEALIIELDALEAASFNISLSNPWGPGIDHVEHSGAFNQSQARPDANGNFTFVISREDPHVYNWLDTDGFDSGKLLVRWQGLPPGMAEKRGPGAIRRAEIVKLSDLRAHLAPEMPIVTAGERRQQLAERTASWRRRLVCQPDI